MIIFLLYVNYTFPNLKKFFEGDPKYLEGALEIIYFNSFISYGRKPWVSKQFTKQVILGRVETRTKDS